MSVDEFYEYITQQMTPEEALKKLLEGSIGSYEALKFDGKDTAVHPLIIASMAAMDMGWSLLIQHADHPGQEVTGLVMGTKEYLSEMLPG